MPGAVNGEFGAAHHLHMDAGFSASPNPGMTLQE
jgi:hypothetical protein